MKILYVDTETTGIIAKHHEITQIAALVEIDGEIVDEINILSRPQYFDRINDEALRVTGKTKDELEKYPSASESFLKFKAFLDKHIDKYDKFDKFYPAGHNVIFDLDFLQHYFITHGDQYGTGAYQNWQALDTRILANFLCYKKKIDVTNCKLETLCEFFQIPIVAHDAMNDIKATRILMQKMLEL